jgi:hypothetical protein
MQGASRSCRLEDVRLASISGAADSWPKGDGRRIHRDAMVQPLPSPRPACWRVLRVPPSVPQRYLHLVATSVQRRRQRCRVEVG